MRIIGERSSMMGAVLVLLLVVFALFGPWLSAFDPNVSDFVGGRGALGLPAGPGTIHLLGTDSLYRDLFARLAAGARVSLSVGLGAAVMTVSLGTTLGVLAGVTYRSRWRFVDVALMRIVDAGLAFPYLLLVMALATVIDGTGAWTVILVLGTTGWMGTARLIRAKTIQLRGRTFVLAARALGLSPWTIAVRHVLPHVAGLILVIGSSAVASMILAESVLSYLGIGVEPPTATWGRMLREGQTYFTADPRLVALPASMILLAVVGFNLLGEGLRDGADARG